MLIPKSCWSCLLWRGCEAGGVRCEAAPLNPHSLAATAPRVFSHLRERKERREARQPGRKQDGTGRGRGGGGGHRGGDQGEGGGGGSRSSAGQQTGSAASNDPVKSAPSLQLNSEDREGDARVQFSAVGLQFEFIRMQKNKFKKIQTCSSADKNREIHNGRFRSTVVWGR